MAYNELERRGTGDFPVEYYHLDAEHPRYHMSAHWHNEIELIRILEGELVINLDTREYHAQRGDILFFNPETIHHGTPKDCVYECIVFHIDFLYTDTYSCKFFIDSIRNGDYIIQEYFPNTMQEIQTYADNIFASLKHKSSGYKFRTIGAFYNFFAFIIDHHMYRLTAGNKMVAQNKNILKLKKILSYIRKNYDKPITLEDMANTAEMSVKYFGTFFKTMTGKTPVDYLNAYRIEKAARKLASTDFSVTDIAYSCGFNDLSYFIKTFKKINHISPGKYRKNKEL